MAFPSVTYTFTNGTTADATQVNQNFTDLINGSSDGTKSYSISALTCGSTATFQSTVILGNASGNDITFNGSMASSLPIKTNTTYDIGAATIGLRALYIGGTSTFTTKIQGGTQTGSLSYTLPVAQGAASSLLSNDGSGNLSWTTTTVGCRYVSTNGGAVGTSLTTYKFETIDYDTNSAYSTSTGVFTAPVAGKYLVIWALQMVFRSGETTQFQTRATLLKNGSTQTTRLYTVWIGSVNTFPFMYGSTTVTLAANDTLTLQFLADAATTAVTTVGQNELSIVLIR